MRDYVTAYIVEQDTRESYCLPEEVASLCSLNREEIEEVLGQLVFEDLLESAEDGTEEYARYAADFNNYGAVDFFNRHASAYTYCPSVREIQIPRPHDYVEPVTVRETTVGTANFTCRQAANIYFRSQEVDVAGVQELLDEGYIAIGVPGYCKKTQGLLVDKEEGRYKLYERSQND